MEVQIKTVALFRVLFVREVGPYTITPCRAWEKLCTWARPRGLLGPDTTYIGVSHDDPDVTPPGKCRFDACIKVPQEIVPEGDIGVQEIGGGEFAVAIHRGSYAGLGDVYRRLCEEWLPQHRYRMRGVPPFEIYLNNAEITPEADLLTEIYLPVKTM